MSGSKNNKQFDPEYKKEMVCLVEDLGKSPRVKGVNMSTIHFITYSLYG